MYRAVDITFWDDPKVADAFTPQERYFMLYLITNNHTNSTGCYGLSIRRAASETGYDESQICDLLERMEKVYNVIRFSEQTREVLVLNFHKYNWNRSPKTLKSIRTQAVGIKDPSFKQYIFDCLDKVNELHDVSFSLPFKDDEVDKASDTVSIPYPKGHKAKKKTSSRVKIIKQSDYAKTYRKQNEDPTAENEKRIAEQAYEKAFEDIQNKYGKAFAMLDKIIESGVMGSDTVSKALQYPIDTPTSPIDTVSKGHDRVSKGMNTVSDTHDNPSEGVKPKNQGEKEGQNEVVSKANVKDNEKTAKTPETRIKPSVLEKEDRASIPHRYPIDTVSSVGASTGTVSEQYQYSISTVSEQEQNNISTYRKVDTDTKEHNQSQVTHKGSQHPQTSVCVSPVLSTDNTNNTVSTNQASGTDTSSKSTQVALVKNPSSKKKSRKRKGMVKNSRYQKFADYWNHNVAERTGVSSVKGITAKREQALQARINDYSEKEILNAFDMVARSSFLTGHNEHHWAANFDWVLNVNNFQKVIEGNYKDRKTSAPKQESSFNVAMKEMGIIPDMDDPNDFSDDEIMDAMFGE